VGLAFWTWFLLIFEAEPSPDHPNAERVATSLLSVAVIWGGVALVTCLGLLLAWQRRRTPVVEEP
jgi:hypothetical protein